MMRLGPLRERINNVARETLAPVPLGFWESAFPKDLIALCYHVVSDEELEHIALYPYKSAAQFEADVVFARERAVTYRQVVASRLSDAPLRRNSLLFTFDDGLAQCFSVIRPILQRHGVDGVFFVTTGYLDDAAPFFECTVSRCLRATAEAPAARVEAVLAELGSTHDGNPNSEWNRHALGRLEHLHLPTNDEGRRRLFLRLMRMNEADRAQLERIGLVLGIAPSGQKPYFMTRREVKELAAGGFTIGAHGLTHRSLEHLDARELEREIVTACEVVRDETGQGRVPFAFPYRGIAVDRHAIADILRRNPLVELVFDSGCLRRDPRFIVNRIFADAPPTTASTNLPATLRGAWSVPSAWYGRTRAN